MTVAVLALITPSVAVTRSLPVLPPSMRLLPTMDKKANMIIFDFPFAFAVHLAHPSLPPADPLDWGLMKKLSWAPLSPSIH